jgi:hypothetical protein
MWIVQPEKRPLLPGLAAAAAALWLRLQWPPTPRRDAVWAALLAVAALSLANFERRLARRDRPSVLLRWVAGGVGVVALAQLFWLGLHAA